jgi:hypothetical protein
VLAAEDRELEDWDRIFPVPDHVVPTQSSSSSRPTSAARSHGSPTTRSPLRPEGQLQQRASAGDGDDDDGDDDDAGDDGEVSASYRVDSIKKHTR